MRLAVEVDPSVQLGPNKEFGPGIVGIGAYLPEQVRDNNWFVKEGLDTSDEWILSRTGIKTRHIAATHESTSTMAEASLRNALEMAEMAPEELDEIIVPTATDDFIFPSSGNIVQGRMVPDNFTPAMSINNACNGGLRGLEAAFAYVTSHFRQRVAVATAETLSRFVKYTDRSTCVLFGDGGGTFIVAPVKDPGPSGFSMKSDGRKSGAIIFEGGGSVFPTTQQTLDEGKHGVKMEEGNEVFKDAQYWMSRMFHEAREKAGVNLQDINWLFFHNANSRIVEAAARETGGKELGEWCLDRAICYVEDMGNISAASIPVAMTRAFKEGWIQKGDLIGMAAIGAGLNMGGAVVRWNIPNPIDRPEGKFHDNHHWLNIDHKKYLNSLRKEQKMVNE